MGSLAHALENALQLIVSADAEVWTAVATSLRVSLAACGLAAATGVPLGVLLARRRFRGRRAVQLLLNTLMALPTVVVGLLLYMLLSRRGPMGASGLLFTPTAIVAGEYILALPIVINLSAVTVRGLDPALFVTCRALGASRLQETLTVVREARYGLVAAAVAAFGRVVGEVGVAMMVGGNIKGATRTMTTAIALETSKGEFEFGLALGVLLLVVALAVNAVLFVLQEPIGAA